MANDLVGTRLIRLPEVIRRTGLGRSSIYARQAAGAFPTPVSLGTGVAVAWIESEVEAWIAAQIAKRDAKRVRHVEPATPRV